MTSRWDQSPQLKMLFGCVLIISLLSWTGFRMMRRLSVEPYIDFQAFYLAADAARTGENPYRAGIEMYIYLPMLAAWMTPLSKLTIIEASWIWFGLALMGTLLSLGLVWRTLGERFQWKSTAGDMMLTLGLTLLVWQTQCRWEFEQGQTDWLMLLALSVALYFLDRSPVIVGMALGFAINIKYLPLVLVIYLLMRRRWHAVLWTAVGTLFWALAPALVYGWDRNLMLLGQGLAGLAKLIGIQIDGQAGYVFPLTYDRSVSIPSVWGRFAEANGFTLTFIAAMTLLTMGMVMLIGWGMYHVFQARLFVRRGGVQELQPETRGWSLLEFCFMILLMIVFSPQAQMRHFFLLLPLVMTTAWLCVCGGTLPIRVLALAGLATGVLASVGADIFGLFELREAWKYLSGASLGILIMGFLTLAAGLQEIRLCLGTLSAKENERGGACASFVDNCLNNCQPASMAVGMSQ